MVYGLLGAARGKVTGEAHGYGLAGQETLTGWTAGLGVEHKLGHGLSLVLEASHVDLGTMKLPRNCAGACRSDIEYSKLKVGVNYRW